jgi:hypothetical protein
MIEQYCAVLRAVRTSLAAAWRSSGAVASRAYFSVRFQIPSQFCAAFRYFRHWAA